MINSFLNASNTSFMNLKTIKKLGSCFSGINSKFEIFNINVQNYEINCIYLSESHLNLTQSSFAINDEVYVNKIEKIIQNFGTIWCEDGVWFDRHEYDGSEYWDFHKYPTIPALEQWGADVVYAEDRQYNK